MMNSEKKLPLQPVRGTHDIFGDTLRRQHNLYDLCQRLGSAFGYQLIETPIFEYAGVFQRTLGDTSDIVGKETYTFLDRGGEEITLRPEGTASIVRSIISNGLAQNLPLKLMYKGPMFRYERPQKGRYRQFHQFGIESLGFADPYADVECIALGVEILSQLGIAARLEINTLGDFESRQAYRQVLVSYLEKYVQSLSADSQIRLQKNPLRILDSKDAGDRKILEGAPVFDAYLTPAAQAFYERVHHGLDLLSIPAHHNPRLVRGLDYYCHTAFEIVHDDLGAKNTLLAGGRYDGLMEQMGGPAVAGVGWALGVERLASLLQGSPAVERPFAVVPVTEAEQGFALQLVCQLRRQGYGAELCYGNNVGKRMKHANKVMARLALILGPDELVNGQVVVKDLDTGQQQVVDTDHLGGYLANH